MSELSAEDLAIGERKFLHDLSNQLVVAQGMGTFVIRFLEKESGKEAKEYQRMEKTKNAIDKIIEMVKERRSVLHEVSGHVLPPGS